MSRDPLDVLAEALGDLEPPIERSLLNHLIGAASVQIGPEEWAGMVTRARAFATGGRTPEAQPSSTSKGGGERR